MKIDGFLPDHYTVRMSRPFLGFRTLSLVIITAGFSAGCETIYSDVYSPKRSRFVAPVERTVVTELPPESAASALPPVAPVEMAPAPVIMPEAAPVDPGMEPAPGLPGMEAAPADPAMPAPVPAVDPAMGGAPADPVMPAPVPPADETMPAPVPPAEMVPAQ